ncbi:MAG: YfcE family phosphodiesterase [Actinobacteria bacterium]|nr:YfcE family phosphodiesterase [Actinomycetota bacterium]
MKIALISDTHDHTDRLSAALEVFAARRAEVLIHAGDMVAPFTARGLITFDGPIRATFGNCDGERTGLSNILKKSIAAPPVTFELAGRSFVLAHDISQIPDALLSTADVAVVGHTHSPSRSQNGRALVVNPGECCGLVTGQSTVALLDTDDLSMEVISLP